MSAKHRLILPGPGPSQSQEAEVGSSRQLTKKNRRSSQHIACEACRKKRTACDGTRPVCTPCTQRNRDECMYASARDRATARANVLQHKISTLDKRLNGQSRLVDYLRSSSDAQAATLLQRLRSAPDPGTVIASLSGGWHPNSQPSDLLSARASAPPTRSATEFELMARFNSAYPKLFPTDLASLVAALDRRAARMNEAKTPSVLSKVNISASAHDGESSGGEVAPSPATKQGKRLAPSFSLRMYCDDRLKNIDIAFWCKVPLSNELAATLISFYLETDHAFLGFFDADLFLDDLANCRLDFCSSFLVSALLCFACQEYTAINRDITRIRPALFKEAQMLYKGEASNDSILSVAAIGLFGAACLFEGWDTLGVELSVAGQGMAERLGILGPSAAAVAADMLQDKPPRTHVIFFHHEPMIYGPALPIPGDLRTGRSSSLSRPPHIGHSFPRLCRLWRVAQEITAVYILADEASISDRVPLAFAEAKFWQLLSGLGHGTAGIELAERPSADEVLFHIMLHVVIIVLFRPFTSEPPECRLQLFTSIDSHPKAICAASIAQLQSTVAQCRTNYREALSMPFLNLGVVMLALGLLEGQSDPLRHDGFLLCWRCWKDLYVCYPVFRDVAQAMLAVALQKEAIQSDEAQILMDELDYAGKHHSSFTRATTRYTVDSVGSAGGESQIHAMAEQLDELILFDRLTTGEMC